MECSFSALLMTRRSGFRPGNFILLVGILQTSCSICTDYRLARARMSNREGEKGVTTAGPSGKVRGKTPYKLRNPYAKPDKLSIAAQSGRVSPTEVAAKVRSDGNSPVNVPHDPDAAKARIDETIRRQNETLEQTGKSYRISLLKKMYKKAKKKANDLGIEKLQDGGKSSSIPIKMHGQQAARVYLAISTLLYSSISVAKAEELEKFIQRKGANLPASIFDLKKWESALIAAQDLRTGSYMNTYQLPNTAKWAENTWAGTTFQPETAGATDWAAVTGGPKDNDNEWDLFETEAFMETTALGGTLEDGGDSLPGNALASPEVKDSRNNNWVKSPVTAHQTSPLLVKSVEGLHLEGDQVATFMEYLDEIKRLDALLQSKDRFMFDVASQSIDIQVEYKEFTDGVRRDLAAMQNVVKSVHSTLIPYLKAKEASNAKIAAECLAGREEIVRLKAKAKDEQENKSASEMKQLETDELQKQISSLSMALAESDTQISMWKEKCMEAEAAIEKLAAEQKGGTLTEQTVRSPEAAEMSRLRTELQKSSAALQQMENLQKQYHTNASASALQSSLAVSHKERAETLIEAGLLSAVRTCSPSRSKAADEGAFDSLRAQEKEELSKLRVESKEKNEQIQLLRKQVRDAQNHLAVSGAELKVLSKTHETALEGARKQHSAQVNSLRKAHIEELDKIEAAHQAQISTLRQKEVTMDSTRKAHEDTLKALRSRIDTLQTELDAKPTDIKAAPQASRSESPVKDFVDDLVKNAVSKVSPTKSHQSSSHHHHHRSNRSHQSDRDPHYHHHEISTDNEKGKGLAEHVKTLEGALMKLQNTLDEERSKQAELQQKIDELTTTNEQILLQGELRFNDDQVEIADLRNQLSSANRAVKVNVKNLHQLESELEKQSNINAVEHMHEVELEKKLKSLRDEVEKLESKKQAAALVLTGHINVHEANGRSQHIHMEKLDMVEAANKVVELKEAELRIQDLEGRMEANLVMMEKKDEDYEKQVGLVEDLKEALEKENKLNRSLKIEISRLEKQGKERNTQPQQEKETESPEVFRSNAATLHATHIAFNAINAGIHMHTNSRPQSPTLDHSPPPSEKSRHLDQVKSIKKLTSHIDVLQQAKMEVEKENLRLKEIVQSKDVKIQDLRERYYRDSVSPGELAEVHGLGGDSVKKSLRKKSSSLLQEDSSTAHIAVKLKRQATKRTLARLEREVEHQLEEILDNESESEALEVKKGNHFSSDKQNSHHDSMHRLLSDTFANAHTSAVRHHMSNRDSTVKELQQQHNKDIALLKEELAEARKAGVLRWQEFAVGSKVEANYASSGQWYRGSVTAIKGENDSRLFNIEYDDGDKEEDVLFTNIRLIPVIVQQAPSIDGEEMQKMKDQLASMNSKVALLEMSNSAKTKDMEILKQELLTEATKLQTEHEKLVKELENAKSDLLLSKKELQKAQAPSPEIGISRFNSSISYTDSQNLPAESSVVSLASESESADIPDNSSRNLESTVKAQVATERAKWEVKITSMESNHRATISTMKQQIQGYKEQIKKFGLHSEEMEILFATKDATIDELQETIQQLREEIENKSDKVQVQVKAMSELQQKYTSLMSQLAILQKEKEKETTRRKGIVGDMQIDDLNAINASGTPSPLLRNLTAGSRNGSIDESKVSHNPLWRPRLPGETPFDPSELEDPNQFQIKAAISIQRIVRGFLGKAAINHMLIERSAQIHGILVAYRPSGTVQGGAGWYVSNGHLYYFALDKGEFVLLAGPLSAEEYDSALEDLAAKNVAPSSIYAGQVDCDRLGLHATRRQISLLNHQLDHLRHELGPDGALQKYSHSLQGQIHDRDKEIKNLKDKLNVNDNSYAELQQDLKENVEIVARERDIALKLRSELRNAAHALETEKLQLKGDASGAIDAEESPRSTFNTPRGSIVAIHHQMHSTKIDPKAPPKSLPRTLKSVLRSARKCTSEHYRGIVVVQAYVRRFLVNSRMRRKNMHEQASKKKLLIAMPGSTQGQNGWYLAPDGGIYYFVMQRNEWIMAAGPLNEKEYHSLLDTSIRVVKPGKYHENSFVSSSESNRKTIRYANGNSVAQGRKTFRQQALLPVGSKYDAKGPALLKCKFDLSVERADIEGKVYIDKKTKKLFVAVSVDKMVENSTPVILRSRQFEGI